MYCKKALPIIILLIAFRAIAIAQFDGAFEWPNGAELAVSLTWDDACESQVKVGTALLNEYGIKATFYVLPASVEKVLKNWKEALKSGHEIGNHSIVHPCSGNFRWSRKHALEDYSLRQLEEELDEANKRIKELLGITPTNFAYPCGQSFVGRGQETQSYVPIIDKYFVSGRTYRDEVPNDPSYCDLAQITGVEMDDKDFSYIETKIEESRQSGSWLVLAGHEIGDKGSPQTTSVEMLNQLLPYLSNSKNKVWIATVGEVAAYINDKRKTK